MKITIRLIILPLLIAMIVALAELPLAEAARAGEADNYKLFEPLFGIKYSTATTQFESAPLEVFRCKDLRSAGAKLWLFGRAVKNRTEFYYVYGVFRSAGRYEAQHDDGTIAVVSPDGCRDISAGNVFTSDKNYRVHAESLGITEEVASELLSDAVDREVKAFGGVAKFLDKVRAVGVDESLLHPQLRLKLQELKRRGKVGQR